MALAIREKGPGSTRLSHDELLPLLTHPRLHPKRESHPTKVDTLKGHTKYWRANRSPYYWLDPVVSPDDTRRTLQELSLLRSDGQRDGFLHDSLIDFFQGFASFLIWLIIFIIPVAAVIIALMALLWRLLRWFWRKVFPKKTPPPAPAA